MATVLVHQDITAIADTAAQMAAQGLNDAIGAYGQATWLLAGGTAPMAAYQVIADIYRKKIDWANVTVAIGDERLVPPEQPDSNYFSINTALLQPAKLHDNQIFWPNTALAAEAAAADYASLLASLPEKQPGIPRLDQVWLGVGEDGHTLSLFPGNPALQITDALVVPVHDAPKPPPDRISMSLRGLWGTRNCLIIATGSTKAPVIARALKGDDSLPITKAVTLIEQAGGQVTWLLDKASAGQTGL